MTLGFLRANTKGTGIVRVRVRAGVTRVRTEQSEWSRGCHKSLRLPVGDVFIEASTVLEHMRPMVLLLLVSRGSAACPVGDPARGRSFVRSAAIR